MLLLGLYLAETLLGAVLPDEVARQTRSVPAIRLLAQRVRHRLFEREPGDTGGWESCRFHFAAREYWLDRVRYGLYLALAPNLADWMFLSLPQKLAPLYYLVRPVRLIVKNSKQLMH